jgi:hypothetical protein
MEERADKGTVHYLLDASLAEKRAQFITFFSGCLCSICYPTDL